MIVHEEQDGKIDLTLDDKDKNKETIKSIVNSRIGGVEKKQEETEQPMKVIVDMREFRSELPSMLHKRGFLIEPVTLEVGDYVLTPTICVERKSINDLIESLSNGRLYNQCNAMSRSYKTPILLIEFDRNKPFQLYVRILSNFYFDL
jgi:DNA excision repair protein ERCC-4